MSAAVVRGDALRLPLAGESVDLVVTSPPYFALRSYRDDDAHYHGQLGSEETPQAFLEALWAVTAECWRVLKPTGSMWVNLGDKYAGSGGHNNSNLSPTAGHSRGPAGSYRRDAPTRYIDGGTMPNKSLMGLPWRYAIGCIDGRAAPEGQRWILRAEVVWSKPNGLPESVTDRVRRSHEQWFHMVKSPRYFSAVDEVREAHTYPDDDGPGRGTKFNSDRQDHGTPLRRLNPLGKLPGSVWNIPSEPLIIPPAVARHYNLPDHFAAFPKEWPRRIILGWSPSGICVECGEGRRPVVGTRCEECGALRPNQAKSCPDCGHVRAWKDGRVQDEALGSRDWSTAGHGTPRHPGNHQNRSEREGYACACQEAIASTRPAVILDPFGGTGTVAMVARALGRFGISLDLSADYCRLARWRIFESQHAEKAMQRTHKENQGDLFSTPPERPVEDVMGL